MVAWMARRRVLRRWRAGWMLLRLACSLGRALGLGAVLGCWVWLVWWYGVVVSWSSRRAPEPMLVFLWGWHEDDRSVAGLQLELGAREANLPALGDRGDG